MEEITKAIASKVEEKDILLTKLLNNVVDDEDYIVRKNKLEEQIKELEAKRAYAEESSKEFQNAVATAFRLASKAHQLFTVSQNQDKHDLIEFMFAKLQLRSKKLEFTLRKPFDLMVNLSKCKTWLQGLRKFRTSEYENVIECSKYFEANRATLQELKISA